MPESVDGWNEYAKHVLKELERHSAWMERQDEKFATHQRDTALAFAKIESELATLKVKAGMWGALAGAVPGVAVVVFHAMSGK